MKRVSAKRRRQLEQEDRPTIRRAVFERDRWTCQLERVEGAGACFGGLTYQHRRKESQGGAYTVDNGVTLCAGHNTRIEAEADLARIARQRGLVLRAGDQP